MNLRSISFFLSLFCFPISLLSFINILYSSYFDYFLSIEAYFSTLVLSLILGLSFYFIGKKANIGAGTITCNYDGIKKNKTIIDDGVFVGSNSSLVAPIKLEKKSIIGAGSVITKKVSKNSLALTRVEQKEVKNYKRKK